MKAFDNTEFIKNMSKMIKGACNDCTQIVDAQYPWLPYEEVVDGHKLKALMLQTAEAMEIAATAMSLHLVVEEDDCI